MTRTPNDAVDIVDLGVSRKFRILSVLSAAGFLLLPGLFAWWAALAFDQDDPGQGIVLLVLAAPLLLPAWVRLRRLWRPRGRLVLTRDTLTIEHPAILRRALEVPREEVLAVASDALETDRRGRASARFAVHPAFRWGAEQGQPPLVHLYTRKDGAKFPILGYSSEEPNLLVLLRSQPIALPVRRSWFWGLKSRSRFTAPNEASFGLLLVAPDADSARQAFARWGVARPLVEQDLLVAPPPVPAEDEAAAPEFAPVAVREARSPRARALLAVGLTIGFVALVAAYLVGSIALLLAAPTFPTLVLAISAIALATAIVPWVGRTDAYGVPLPPGDHPALHELVAEAAAAVGARAPDEIRLIPAVNANVYEARGRRIMSLGYPLLALLERDRLRFVVGHELAHLRGGDTSTALQAPLIVTERAILRSLRRLDRGRSMSWLVAPIRWVVLGYAKLFFRLTADTRQRQEFAADRIAAAHAGVPSGIAALRDITRADIAFEAFLQCELGAVIESGHRPPLAEGLRRFVAQPEQTAGIDEAADSAIAHEPPDPWGTHPPTRDRVAHLASLAAESTDVPVDASIPEPSALELVGRREELEVQLMRDLIGAERAERLVPCSWDETVQIAFLPLWREKAQSMSPVLDGRVVADVPAILADPSAVALAMGAITTDGMDPAEIADGARATVGHALCAALAEAGFRLYGEPGGPVSAERGDVRIEPIDRVWDLAAGEIDASGWQVMCDRAGIASLPLAVPDTAPGSPDAVETAEPAVSA